MQVPEGSSCCRSEGVPHPVQAQHFNKSPSHSGMWRRMDLDKCLSLAEASCLLAKGLSWASSRVSLSYGWASLRISGQWSADCKKTKTEPSWVWNKGKPVSGNSDLWESHTRTPPEVSKLHLTRKQFRGDVPNRAQLQAGGLVWNLGLCTLLSHRLLWLAPGSPWGTSLALYPRLESAMSPLCRLPVVQGGKRGSRFPIR